MMTSALVSDPPRCRADPSPALLPVKTIRSGPRVSKLLTNEIAPPYPANALLWSKEALPWTRKEESEIATAPPRQAVLVDSHSLRWWVQAAVNNATNTRYQQQ